MRKSIFFGLILFSSMAAGQLVLHIESGKKTRCHGLAEVVLSRGDQFLFHTSIPVGGNAEFKLVPGKYQVRALTREKCASVADFEFKGAQIKVTTELAPERKPANFGYMGGSSGFAPQTPTWPSPSMWGVPWWYQSYNPWYSNFNSPCAWNPGYCMGPYYPSGGPIAMGKPNLYFQSKDAATLHVRLIDQSFKGLMASSPAHLEKGWSIKLKSSGVEHGGITYPYLFYDLRTSETHLQVSAGFCGDKDVLLKRMDAVLSERKYPEAAVKDFRDYWSVHFPAGQRYCVLPQLEKEMNLSAPLEFSERVDLVRSLFLVIPEFVKKDDPRMPSSLKKIDLSKLKPWTIEKTVVDVDKAAISAFEWGLAFLFANSPATASNASGVSDFSRGSSAPVSQ